MCENFQLLELHNSVDCFPDASKSSSSHGRWTKEEHARFIEGMRLFGKNWRKVEEFIGTRTGAQIRSHAQKVFNRSDKIIQDDIPLKSNTEQLPEKTTSPQVIGQIQRTKGSDEADDEDNHLSNTLSKNKKIEQTKIAVSTCTTTPLLTTSSPPSSYCANPQLPQSSSNSSRNKKSNKISEKTFLKTLQQLQQSYKHSQKLEQSQHHTPFANQQQQQQQHTPQQYIQHSAYLQLSHPPQATFSASSPADFIDQASLSTIFEPADIQTHLLQFYIAQVSLENMMMVSQSSNQLENHLQSQQSPLLSQLPYLANPQDTIQPRFTVQHHHEDNNCISLTSSARSSASGTLRTTPNSIQNRISSNNNYQHNNNTISKELKHDCLTSMNHYQEDSNSSDNSNSFFPVNQQDVETQLLSLFLTHFQQPEAQQQQQQQLQIQEQQLQQHAQQHQLIAESAELQALMVSLLQSSQKESETVDSQQQPQQPLEQSQQSPSWESNGIAEESCSSNLSDCQSQFEDVSESSSNISSKEE